MPKGIAVVKGHAYGNDFLLAPEVRGARATTCPRSRRRCAAGTKGSAPTG